MHAKCRRVESDRRTKYIYKPAETVMWCAGFSIWKCEMSKRSKPLKMKLHSIRMIESESERHTKKCQRLIAIYELNRICNFLFCAWHRFVWFGLILFCMQSVLWWENVPLVNQSDHTDVWVYICVSHFLLNEWGVGEGPHNATVEKKIFNKSTNITWWTSAFEMVFENGWNTCFATLTRA